MKKDDGLNRKWLLLPRQCYQVEVHQATVKRTLRLNAAKLALLFFCAEKIIEAVAFVKGKVTFLVVGIDE